MANKRKRERSGWRCLECGGLVWIYGVLREWKCLCHTRWLREAKKR